MNCRICKAPAVTRVPYHSISLRLRALHCQGCDVKDGVPVCGACAVLHSNDTIEGDGPRRDGPTSAERYAAKLLAILEESCGPVAVRTDGVLIFQTDRVAADSAFLDQLARYRPFIVRLIGKRLAEEKGG